MNNHEIKDGILELIGLVLDIQMRTLCPTHISMNPQIGSITITIGWEMERKIDFFNPQYEKTIYYFDDWSNDQFAMIHKYAKKDLEKILLDCLVINE